MMAEVDQLIQAVMEKYNCSEEQARKAVTVVALVAEKQQRDQAGGGEAPSGVRARGGKGGGLDMGDLLGSLLGGGQQGQQGGSDLIGSLLGSVLGGDGQQGQQGSGNDLISGLLGSVLGGSGQQGQSAPQQKPPPPAAQGGSLMDSVSDLLDGGNKPGKKPDMGSMQDKFGDLMAGKPKPPTKKK